MPILGGRSHPAASPVRMAPIGLEPKRIGDRQVCSGSGLPQRETKLTLQDRKPSLARLLLLNHGDDFPVKAA